jgi:hypothetical protein
MLSSLICYLIFYKLCRLSMSASMWSIFFSLITWTMLTWFWLIFPLNVSISKTDCCYSYSTCFLFSFWDPCVFAWCIILFYFSFFSLLIFLNALFNVVALKQQYDCVEYNHVTFDLVPTSQCENHNRMLLWFF